MNYIPNIITKKWLDEQYETGKILPVKELKDGCIYKGSCRNAGIALWDKATEKFYYIRYKWGTEFIEKINNLENDDGYDLFIPYYKIDAEENKNVIKLRTMFAKYIKKIIRNDIGLRELFKIIN